ncbi:hypothetical protein EVAR_96161_1 [Eumeta japonica]|uniref:Uncharacterized protein n=1 Tax=Eumeta variegata TaxID=151549 RepID=A0A4C1VIZ7_EUMVA|nr:hypothetical protein EVAR_96161_1 [Eumeta japonica]
MTDSVSSSEHIAEVLISSSLFGQDPPAGVPACNIRYTSSSKPYRALILTSSVWLLFALLIKYTFPQTFYLRSRALDLIPQALNPYWASLAQYGLRTCFLREHNPVGNAFIRSVGDARDYAAPPASGRTPETTRSPTTQSALFALAPCPLRCERSGTAKLVYIPYVPHMCGVDGSHYLFAASHARRGIFRNEKR